MNIVTGSSIGDGAFTCGHCRQRSHFVVQGSPGQTYSPPSNGPATLAGALFGQASPATAIQFATCPWCGWQNEALRQRLTLAAQQFAGFLFVGFIGATWLFLYKEGAFVCSALSLIWAFTSLIVLAVMRQSAAKYPAPLVLVPTHALPPMRAPRVMSTLRTVRMAPIFPKHA